VKSARVAGPVPVWTSDIENGTVPGVVAGGGCVVSGAFVVVGPADTVVEVVDFVPGPLSLLQAGRGDGHNDGAETTKSPHAIVTVPHVTRSLRVHGRHVRSPSGRKHSRTWGPLDAPNGPTF
jgi:hypothetical protein